MFHTTTRVTFLATIVATTMMLAEHVNAATFRITSKIYEGANLNAATEHWTLFDNGLVYDLPQVGGQHVTVYDSAQKQVTLLDRQNQTQTTLSTDDLVKVTAQARAAATTPQQQERLGLTTSVEPSKRVIGYMLRFGNFEYHATTQTPDDPTVAVDYGRFVIVAKRLDIVRRTGPPPFARMTLSEHIAAKGELPLETTLTIRRGEASTEFRSTHAMQELTDADREKINEVRGMLELYREVPPNNFP